MYFSERNSFKKPHQNQMNNKRAILKKKKIKVSGTLGPLVWKWVKLKFN
jgi:hypothetical protein